MRHVWEVFSQFCEGLSASQLIISYYILQKFSERTFRTDSLSLTDNAIVGFVMEDIHPGHQEWLTTFLVMHLQNQSTAMVLLMFIFVPIYEIWCFQCWRSGYRPFSRRHIPCGSTVIIFTILYAWIPNLHSLLSTLEGDTPSIQPRSYHPSHDFVKVTI